jgi:hypothetical protein
MIAYQTGDTILWDAKSGQITDHPTAAAMMKRPYRSPWVHPFPG